MPSTIGYVERKATAAPVLTDTGTAQTAVQEPTGTLVAVVAIAAFADAATNFRLKDGGGTAIWGTEFIGAGGTTVQSFAHPLISNGLNLAFGTALLNYRWSVAYVRL